MRAFQIASAIALLAYAAAAQAAPKALPANPSALDHWSFQGWGGSYNYETIQKGFAVYQSDCASCHGLSLVHLRDLRQLGLSAEEVSAIASSTKIVKGLDAKGKPELAPATVNDVFRSPYSSPETAAKQFNAAIPQDLSLAARGAPGGAKHIYAILTGYRTAPPNMDMIPGHYYNIAVPGRQIAMAQPLKPGSVTLADGSKPNTVQMAHDVTEFLAWTSDPNLDNRKRTGYGAIFFLAFLGILIYMVQHRSKDAA